VWSVESQQSIGQPIRIVSRIIALSPDGQVLAAGSDDETARLWDIHTGKAIGVLKAGPVVNAIAFNADGRNVLTGAEGAGARLWDAKTAKPMCSPMKFGAFTTAVAFAPDGRTLLAGCENGQVCRWEAPPLPLADDPALVKSWAKSRTGLVLEDQRTPRRLSQAEWFAAQKAFHRGGRGADHAVNAEFATSGQLEVSENSGYLAPPLATLREKLGKNQTVELDIADVSFRPGLIFLASVGDYYRKDSFSVALQEPQLAQLDKFGIKYADELAGRRIRVTGKLEEYAGRLEIKINDVLSQLQIRSPEGRWIQSDASAQASSEFIDPPVSKLRTLLHQQQTVEFRVQYTGGRNHVYLNSKVDYGDPDCFTAVVEGDQIAGLASLGVAKPTQLIGKVVRVTGTVEEVADRKGQVIVRITDVPAQLKIVEPTESPSPDESR
jgi:DNA/RNA endonuclease YhcR with UshA esterase domain